MGPLCQKMLKDHPQARDEMLSGMHIHPDPEVIRRILEIRDETPVGIMEGIYPAPKDCWVFIEVQDALVVVSMEPDGETIFIGMWFEGQEYRDWGSYKIGGERLRISDDMLVEMGLSPDDPDFNDAAREHPMGRAIIGMAEFVDLLFTFMAEPRWCKQQPVSRTRRQMASKKLGKQALRHTWVKVSWTIGGPTRAKGDPCASGPQKAFHMRKSYWRPYDHKTPLGVRRDFRPGWWVKVAATYVGHPALGEIKHHYTPKMKDPGASSPTVHAVIAAKIAGSLSTSA